MSAASGEDALAMLPGLGPASARMLIDAGITDPVQLRSLGAVAAFARVAAAYGKTPSLNLLYALDGAISQRSWQEVARHDGAALRMAWEDLRSGGRGWAE